MSGMQREAAEIFRFRSELAVPVSSPVDAVLAPEQEPRWAQAGSRVSKPPTMPAGSHGARLPTGARGELVEGVE